MGAVGLNIASNCTQTSARVSVTPMRNFNTSIVVGDSARVPVTASQSGSYLTLVKYNSAYPVVLGLLLDTVNSVDGGAAVQGSVIVDVEMVAGERAVKGSR